MSDPIAGAEDSEQLMQALYEAAQPYGVVLRVQLFCNADTSSDVLCLLDVQGHEFTVANAIGGFVYGQSPARLVRTLAATFTCPGRQDGKVLQTHCSKCRRDWQGQDGVPPPPGTGGSAG